MGETGDSQLAQDFLEVSLPADYRSFSLESYQSLVNSKISRAETQWSGCLDEVFYSEIALVLYSCQFTKFMKLLIKHDKDCFVDAVYMMIHLKNLNLLKTHFRLY